MLLAHRHLQVLIIIIHFSLYNCQQHPSIFISTPLSFFPHNPRSNTVVIIATFRVYLAQKYYLGLLCLVDQASPQNVDKVSLWGFWNDWFVKKIRTFINQLCSLKFPNFSLLKISIVYVFSKISISNLIHILRMKCFAPMLWWRMRQFYVSWDFVDHHFMETTIIYFFQYLKIC